MVSYNYYLLSKIIICCGLFYQPIISRVINEETIVITYQKLKKANSNQ